MEIVVRVIPKSSKTELVGKLADGSLKIRLAAAPEKGRANEALREFLARHFGVAPSHVQIVSGATARVKRVRIEGTTG